VDLCSNFHNTIFSINADESAAHFTVISSNDFDLEKRKKRRMHKERTQCTMSTLTKPLHSGFTGCKCMLSTFTVFCTSGTYRAHMPPCKKHSSKCKAE
jgi:hypothetical protein